MNFEPRRKEETEAIEEILKRYLPKEEGYAATVSQAVSYSVLAGGKRLRPMLMRECFRLFTQEDVREDKARCLLEPFMAAIEFIHTYSLVHDDLPCMDNDEYRRGRKTTHAVYGEGMAVLAGDALLNLAFETATQAFDGARVAGNGEWMYRCAKAFGILAGKAGIGGMIGGQCADTQAEDFPEERISQELLLYIHENKTAAMIESAMMIGGILAGCGEEDVRCLEKIGSKIGLAFQIQDDILDLTSSLEELGKKTGSDLKNHKVTYVSLNGIENSVKEVRRLSKEALSSLKALGNNVFLEMLVEDLITRKK